MCYNRNLLLITTWKSADPSSGPSPFGRVSVRIFHSQRENFNGSWHVPESGSDDTLALCHVHATTCPEVPPKKCSGLERYSFLRRLFGFCCWSFALTLNSWNCVRSTKVKQETQRPWLFWKSSVERINNFVPFKVLTTILLHSSTFLTEGLVTY